MRVNGYPAAELPRQQLLEALSVLTPRALPFQPDEEPVVRPPARRRDPAEGVDWELVVQLRRQASERITENSQHWAGEHGRPMPTDDRRMMGRAVIRAVVRDHAQRLSQSGEQLWALSVEHAYANAVEDAIFGYGRLQPLFEIPTAWWADREGTRRVLTRIVVWWSGFTVATAGAFNYASLLVLRFLFGAGEAGAWPGVARTLTWRVPKATRSPSRSARSQPSAPATAASAQPIITAVAASSGAFRSRFSRVVLPAPRKPVSTVTGIFSRFMRRRASWDRPAARRSQ